MKAPEKIYVEVCEDGIFAFEKPPFEESIEYIRKDAILEWAKQKQYESLTIVADNFWQEVIDKLNEI